MYTEVKCTSMVIHTERGRYTRRGIHTECLDVVDVHNPRPPSLPSIPAGAYKKGYYPYPDTVCIIHKPARFFLEMA